MSKADQKIIVVNKDILFDNGKDFFEGFRPAKSLDYESRILQNMSVMRRGSTSEPADYPNGNAERNPNYKQPIAYVIIANPETGRIFGYQRSSEKQNYSEDRLQGKVSWGFGGHVEPKDGVKNPIRESMRREISEEVDVRGEILGEELLGYIYHDHDVHQVHFGMLYLIKTNAKLVLPKDKEIAWIKPFSISDLEKLCAQNGVEVEAWSRSALGPLKKILR
ncbi:MAG: NUDIX domain-containing protein [Nanoarchaeota archaeon]